MPCPVSPKALKPQPEKQPCILRLRRPSWPTSGRAERPEADRLHSMTAAGLGFRVFVPTSSARTSLNETGNRHGVQTS